MLTIQRLYESGILADVEVRCGDQTWKLHKVILCTRSAWFKKALLGAFEVGTFLPRLATYLSKLLTMRYQESKTRTIILEEKERCDVDCFLKFIYTGSIDLQKSYPGDDTFVALMRIWKTADFFLLDALRNLAVRAANDYAQEHAQVFCTAFPKADHDKEMEVIIKHSFNHAVSLLYSDEMRHLKETFLPIYMGLAAASVHRLSKSEAFQTLLHDVPQFAAEWATTLMGGFKLWSQLRLKRLGGCCYECGTFMGAKGTVDTLKWVQNVRLTVLCDRCYRMPTLAKWKANEESEKEASRFAKNKPAVDAPQPL